MKDPNDWIAATDPEIFHYWTKGIVIQIPQRNIVQLAWDKSWLPRFEYNQGFYDGKEDITEMRVILCREHGMDCRQDYHPEGFEAVEI